MNKYIKESLDAGIIHGGGRVFSEKKDKTLKHCINYRDFNHIIAKNKE